MALRLPKLGDCPFCGSSAEYVQTPSRTSGHGESSDEAGVKCTGCNVSIMELGWADHEVEERQSRCAEKWNKRV